MPLSAYLCGCISNGRKHMRSLQCALFCITYFDLILFKGHPDRLFHAVSFPGSKVVSLKKYQNVLQLLYILLRLY
jgi:hypothetical protein